MRQQVRILSATSVLGSGFSEDSLKCGIERDPLFIGCDGGSTDPGPHFLATNETAFSERTRYRDLRLLVMAAKSKRIPLLIGSCGTAGTNAQVDDMLRLLQRIAREEALSIKAATFYSEQDKEYLRNKLFNGRFTALNNAPSVDAATIDRSIRIVGMAGAEAFQKALESKPDVVIGGRASDSAIFAALPLQEGIPAGICWHAGKILECGAAAARRRKTPDCLFAALERDHFVVEPLDPDLACTPQSVASHALYENADPERLAEPGGVLNIADARYEPLSPRAVKVSGSAFEAASEYTVKLEGVERIGWHTVTFGSIRDPFIVAEIDDWTARLREAVDKRAASVIGAGVDWRLLVRIYGKDGTMGQLEPTPVVHSHEIALVFEILAPDRETATTLASMLRHQALHLPIAKWSGLITSVAFPYSPAHLHRGDLFRFNMKHVVTPDTPLEMFKFGTATF